MKAITKLMVLLTLAMIFISCMDRDVLPPHINRNVFLSFQDVSGNDLVSGIECNYFNNDPFYGEIKKELIDLYIFYDGIYLLSGWATGHNTVSINKKHDNYCYVGLHFNHGKHYPFINKVVYRLRCFYIFGDNNLHEIITYWKSEKEMINHICYRIEFEGKEYTQINYDEYKFSVATIVLER